MRDRRKKAETTGSRVRALRKDRGWTQGQLADRLDGVDQGRVSEWEGGKTEISTANLVQLANKLDCTTDYLLLRSGDPHPVDPTAATLAVAAIEQVIAGLRAGARIVPAVRAPLAEDVLRIETD